MKFTKATKAQSRLRLALMGPSGSGKTFTALRIAKGIGGRIALIDTERGSAAKYSDRFDFDHLCLETYAPETYVEAIKLAEREGYSVLIIDSLSHAWSGREGALEQVDKAAARMKSGNRFAAWKDVTPMQNALVDSMLQSRCHVIATMRVKTEWVLEEDEKGKKVPKKVGLQPVQRDQIEYEFDVAGELDEGKLLITKTRYSKLEKAALMKPGEDFGAELAAWLSDGVPAPVPAPRPSGNPGEMPLYEQLAARLREADRASYADACKACKVADRSALTEQEVDDLRKLVARRRVELWPELATKGAA